MADSGDAPTVLLVDDDPGIRQLLRRVLTEAGYDVLDAWSGSSALAASREHHAKIDLLVTDVVMPGMDGFVLSEILEAIRPTTPVLYVTGDARVIDNLRRGRVMTHWSFLVKPFTPKAFLERVRTIRAADHPASAAEHSVSVAAGQPSP